MLIARGGSAMNDFFEQAASRVTEWSGRPLAFILSLLVVIIWIATGPIFDYSNTWQLVINTGTTIVTFLMVFLIQNAQNRDGSAIQAKLDELIRASRARNEFIGVEHLTQAELLQLLRRLEELSGDQIEHQKAIERLVARR
jgi:low affinity Fe/Cu permease